MTLICALVIACLAFATAITISCSPAQESHDGPSTSTTTIDEEATERIKSGYHDNPNPKLMTAARFDELISQGIDHDADDNMPAILVANATVVEGLAENQATRIHEHGFTNVATSNAPAGSTNSDSYIHYYNEESELAAAQVAAILDIDHRKISGPHSHDVEKSSDGYDIIVHIEYDLAG